MNSFGPQTYAASLKHLIPDGFKLKKESVDLLCAMMFEINNLFVKACSKKNKKLLTAKHVQTSISKLIPNEMRNCAYAAGSNVLTDYAAGLITYKEPKLHKGERLQPKMMRKGLEELVNIIHPNLEISEECTTATGIMHRLALQLADKVIASIGNEPKMSLEQMSTTLRNIVGEELFTHAQGHTDTNVNWYRTGQLDFHLKAIVPQKTEDGDILVSALKKMAKNMFDVSLPMNLSKRINDILIGLANTMMDGAINSFHQNVPEEYVISANDIYLALKSLFPKGMIHTAVTNGQTSLLNYSLGILTYKRSQVKEEAVVPMDVDATEEDYIPDFRRGIRNFAKDYPVSFGKGCLPAVNDVLVDVCRRLVEKSCELAANSCILTASNVFDAVSDLFPGQMQQHALARIRERRDQILQTTGQDPLSPDGITLDSLINENNFTDDSFIPSQEMRDVLQRGMDLQASVPFQQSSREETGSPGDTEPTGTQLGRSSKDSGTQWDQSLERSVSPSEKSSEKVDTQPGKSSEIADVWRSTSLEESVIHVDKSTEKAVAQPEEVPEKSIHPSEKSSEKIVHPSQESSEKVSTSSEKSFERKASSSKSSSEPASLPSQKSFDRISYPPQRSLENIYPPKKSSEIISPRDVKSSETANGQDTITSRQSDDQVKKPSEEIDTNLKSSSSATDSTAANRHADITADEDKEKTEEKTEE